MGEKVVVGLRGALGYTWRTEGDGDVQVTERKGGRISCLGGRS